MPYINQESRDRLHPLPPIRQAGELAYVIEMLALDLLAHRMEAGGPSYATLSLIIGAIDNARTEFYRRVVVPYEEMKMRDNGDVFPSMEDDSRD